MKNGAAYRIRTDDPLITNDVVYYYKVSCYRESCVDIGTYNTLRYV